MTRRLRALRSAVVVLALGGSAGIWVYGTRVRPREALYAARENAKRLFDFGRLDVASGTLRSASATLAFERGPTGAFELTRPLVWPGNATAIDALLDRMAGLKLEPVLTEAARRPELVGWGLEPARITVEVWLRDGTPRRLHIGALNPLVGKYPVTDGQAQRVGLMDKALIWAFDRGADDFRDPRLSPVRADQLRKVVLRRAGDSPRTLELERSAPDGPWRFGGPKDASTLPNPRRVGFWIEAWVDLRGERFLTDSWHPEASKKNDPWGLVPPQGTVDLVPFEGPTVTFQVGRVREDTDVGRWVIHRADTRTVAEVEPSIARAFHVSIEELADQTLSRFDPSEAVEVEVRLGPKERAVLTRTENRWNVAHGPAAAVRHWRVDALVKTLSNLEGETTHRRNPSPRELKEWSLDPAPRRLTVRGEAGSVLADVRVGHRLDEDRWLVQSARAPRVIVVPDARLTSIPKRLEELLSPNGSEEPAGER